MEGSEPIKKKNFREILKKNTNDFGKTYKNEKTEARFIFNIENEEDILPMAQKRYLILNGFIGERIQSKKAKLEMQTIAENEEAKKFKEVLTNLMRHVMENFHLNLTRKEREKITPGKNYLFYIVKNSKELKVLLAISGFGKDGKKDSSLHYGLTQGALDKLFENYDLQLLQGYTVTEKKFIPFSRKKEKYIYVFEGQFHNHSKFFKSNDHFLIKMTLIFKLLQGEMILDTHALQTVLRLPQNSTGYFQDLNATKRAFEKLREKLNDNNDKKLNDRKAKYLTYRILATCEERFSSIVNYEDEESFSNFSENLDFLNKQNCRIHFHCEDESFQSSIKDLWDSHEAKVYKKLLLKLWDRFSNIDIFEFCQYLSQCSEDNLITELCINQKYWKDEGIHYVFSIKKQDKYDSPIAVRPPCMFCMLYFPLEYALEASQKQALPCLSFTTESIEIKSENDVGPFELLSFLLKYDRANNKLNSYLESDIFDEIVKITFGEELRRVTLFSLLNDVIKRDDKTLLELLEKRMQQHGIPLEHCEALLEAAKYGCTALVEYLIEKTDEDFKKNVNGQTAMHHLVRRGDLKLLKIITDKYRGVDIKKEIFQVDNVGQSPVVFAAAFTNVEVFDFLRETVSDEESFFNHMKEKNVIFYPIRSSCLNMLKDIWKLYEEQNAQCELWTKKMEKLTLLGKAAKKGNYEIINFLIEKICDLRTISEAMEVDLAKSLIIAIVEGCTEVVGILMETLKERAPEGMIDVYKWRSSKDESALHCLTFLRNVTLLKEFMTHPGYTIDEIKDLCCKPLSNKGRVSNTDYDTTFTIKYRTSDFQWQQNANPTPLHYAMRTENEEVIKCLVQDYNFDVNAISSNGDTPLHFAAVSGHKSNVTALLKGINSNIDINAKNDKGNTPLHLAAQYGSFEIVKKLIKEGADKDAKNKKGQTPLDFAVLRRHFEVIEHLLEKGAKDDEKDVDGFTPYCFAIANNDEDILKELFSEESRSNADKIKKQKLLHLLVEKNHTITCHNICKYYSKLRNSLINE